MAEAMCGGWWSMSGICSLHKRVEVMMLSVLLGCGNGGCMDSVVARWKWRLCGVSCWAVICQLWAFLHPSDPDLTHLRRLPRQHQRRLTVRTRRFLAYVAVAGLVCVESGGVKDVGDEHACSSSTNLLAVVAPANTAVKNECGSGTSQGGYVAGIDPDGHVDASYSGACVSLVQELTSRAG
eukprot:91416-Chlamydomonas_euryale.AAC.3